MGPFSPVPRVDGSKARELVANGGTLVDVRSAAEFAFGHIPGAKNLPVNQVGALSQQLAKDTAVVLYCASGARSAYAGKILKNVGFDTVYDLGGMHRW